MKYIRLPNGNKRKVYEYYLSNGFIAKFIDEEVSDILNFFGKEIINYIDIVDEQENVLENFDIYMKYRQMNIANEEIIEYEKRLVKDAYDEEVIDEESNNRNIIHHPAVYERVEKKKTVLMMTIILEKPSPADEIDNIKSVVGIKNMANMNVDEFREYHKEEIGKQCTAAIENGVDVETSKGKQHFSYTIEDQSNIKDLVITALISEFTLPLPYHADGILCDVYTPQDIIKIYMALSSNKTYHTTYCNILNAMLEDANDMETIKGIIYGMEITNEKYVGVMDKIDCSKNTLIKLVESKMKGIGTEKTNE